jgi:hypothetical protein
MLNFEIEKKAVCIILMQRLDAAPFRKKTNSSCTYRNQIPSRRVTLAEVFSPNVGV